MVMANVVVSDECGCFLWIMAVWWASVAVCWQVLSAGSCGQGQFGCCGTLIIVNPVPLCLCSLFYCRIHTDHWCTYWFNIIYFHIEVFKASFVCAAFSPICAWCGKSHRRCVWYSIVYPITMLYLLYCIFYFKCYTAYLNKNNVFLDSCGKRTGGTVLSGHM